MTTAVESHETDSHADSFNITLQETYQSWTDDLPVCHYSGVGSSPNQVYQINGDCQEEHPYEDKSFRFCLDPDTSFYGVFDGHCGSRTVEFVSQRMPAEILLGQLKDKNNDSDIKEVLQQAFLTVESSFFQSIDNLLAEKEGLKLQLSGLSRYESVKQKPLTVQKLNSVTAEIQSGASAVVALVHKNKLYIGNVGDCRAVVCKIDESDEKEIIQLSTDHALDNTNELLRLSDVGLSKEDLQSDFKKHHLQCTRCIGNYVLKGGYKEYGNFRKAHEEPIIAEPDVVGGIPLDPTCSYLLLMSKGLYKSLEKATGTEDANRMLVEMFEEQLLSQPTLNEAAQALIDEVASLHYEAFIGDKKASKQCKKRDDMTLLVLNFKRFLAGTSMTCRNQQSSLMATKGSSNDYDPHSMTNTLAPGTNSSDNALAESEESDFFPSSQIQMDEGRISPYVDFSDFYAAVEEAYEKGDVPKEWRKQNAA